MVFKGGVDYLSEENGSWKTVTGKKSAQESSSRGGIEKSGKSMSPFSSPPNKVSRQLRLLLAHETTILFEYKRHYLIQHNTIFQASRMSSAPFRRSSSPQEERQSVIKATKYFTVTFRINKWCSRAEVIICPKKTAPGLP